MPIYSLPAVSIGLSNSTVGMPARAMPSICARMAGVFLPTTIRPWQRPPGFCSPASSLGNCRSSLATRLIPSTMPWLAPQCRKAR